MPAGQPLQAGAVVQQILEAVGVVAAAQQVQQHARVEVAGACAHHQPLQRRQPHRRVDGPAAAHRRRRGAVAQVEDDQGEVGRRPAEEPGCLARDVLVADPVRAVPADAHAPRPLRGPRRTSPPRPAARRRTRCRRPPPGAGRETPHGWRGSRPGPAGCAAAPARPAARCPAPLRRRRRWLRCSGRRRAPLGGRRRAASTGSTPASDSAEETCAKASSQPLSSTLSTDARSRVCSVSGSSTRYFSDDDPALRTSTEPLIPPR